MGAQRPDGGSAKVQRVNFTQPAAERIAKVVRLVEQGNRDSSGIAWNPRMEGGRGGGKVFRVATFTGDWDKNSSKTVTFKNQTTTPNTVSASNLLFDVAGPPTSGASTTKVCIVGKEGTAWYFVNAEEGAVLCANGSYSARELSPSSADDTSSVSPIRESSGPQVLVNDGGCVRWMGMMEYSLISSLELGEEGLTWAVSTLWALPSTVPPAEFGIEVTECPEPPAP